MIVAALAAGLAALGASRWRRPPPSAEAGVLALPHREAELSCESCHASGEPTRACTSCHGDHDSRRHAHARLMARGEMGCITCHDIHGDDQGVRFLAGDPGGVLRYGVDGVRALDLPEAPLHLADTATVPLIPVARCAGCHDVERARDPIQRCIGGSPGQESAEGLQVLTACFDEHQHGSVDEVVLENPVCRAQHNAGRYVSWEAASTVARLEPLPPTGGDPSAPWWWLAAGWSAGILGFFAVGLGRRLRRREPKREPSLASTEKRRLPVVDTSTCLGCYACVDACPYEVLQVDRYVAEVVRPDLCCGLTLCEQVCPNSSLVITDGEQIAGRPRLTAEGESLDTPGVYLAGDVTGMPLIKNAIAQGDRAVATIAQGLGKHRHELDLLIVGAGPAGISAALKAKALGLRYRVVEQGSVAQSIRSFPRGKLVFDQPLDLPHAGELWLEESTKEELLAKWLRVVRREKLSIDEKCRFVGLSPCEGGFVVATQATDDLLDQVEEELSEGTTYRAARVLLTIGRRGSPRQLPLSLDAASESRLHYHLADARSFEGKRLLVVGLGDVAMETAIALARQPGTAVTVSYRGAGFSGGKARNIAELERIYAAGRVRLVFDSKLVALDDTRATLVLPDAEEQLEVDAVFVMIGSVAPTALLARAGVRCSTKKGVEEDCDPVEQKNMPAGGVSA